MHRKKKLSHLLLALYLLTGFCFTAPAEEALILASTTSTLDSGLLDVLVPVFEKANQCKVKVIAVGTGQAIRLARDGNADLLLVHDRQAEEQFVADGFGIERLDVMHNDYVIVGPAADPAGIKNLAAEAAFKKIAQGQSAFVSRGDDSGTHKKEKSIWKSCQLTPAGEWYLESGSGMEATLRIANEKLAYCLIDRSTWLAHHQETDGLTLLAEGDPRLFNSYSVIVVSPQKYPHVNHALASRFADFIRGPEGQKIIREFGKEKFGQPLFFPDVIK